MLPEHPSKYLLLCFTEKRKIKRFGKAWVKLLSPLWNLIHMFTGAILHQKLCLSFFSYGQTIHLFCCSSISWITLKRESPIWLLCRGNIPWSSAVLNYEAMQLKRMISHRCDPSAPGPPRHGNKAMQQFSSKQTRMTTCSTSVSSTLSEWDGCQSFPIASIEANTVNIEHQTLGPRTVHASASAQMEGCGLKTEPERNSKGNNDWGM